MRSATNNQYPRFVIWENVRGALSSNQGKDFHTVLTEMANLGAVDISYRLTNACQYGVPQRRVRVFVVADLIGQCAGEILAQPPRLLWHPPKVGKKGKKASGKTDRGSKGSSWSASRRVTSSVVTGGLNDFAEAASGRVVFTPREICAAVSSKWSKGTGGPAGDEHYNLVTETAYVKSRRAGTKDDYETWKIGAVAPTLNVSDNGGEVRATILAIDGYNQKTDPKLYHSLRTGIDSGDSVMDATYRVRRLTPTECERLQGWPDDHTRYDSEGNELSDSARYKMIGNGIATPVAQWLCENLVAAVEAEGKTTKGSI
jgi:DNA (cytosine-5)-methyltransferase 1